MWAVKRVFAIYSNVQYFSFLFTKWERLYLVPHHDNRLHILSLYICALQRSWFVALLWEAGLLHCCAWNCNKVADFFCLRRFFGKIGNIWHSQSPPLPSLLQRQLVSPTRCVWMGELNVCVRERERRVVLCYTSQYITCDKKALGGSFIFVNMICHVCSTFMRELFFDVLQTAVVKCTFYDWYQITLLTPYVSLSAS